MMRTIGVTLMNSSDIRDAFRQKSPKQKVNVRYCRIVQQVVHTALSCSSNPIQIEVLCRMMGVSQQTLRKAFQVVCGTTPYRHLRTLRMRETREALLSSDSTTKTVTAIAMEFGFFELGRFSVEYRLTFGECPSATLRRTASANSDLVPTKAARRLSLSRFFA
jgi:transcriptional regulator GlxA family with amidase domain